MKKMLVASMLALGSMSTFANCVVEMQYQGSRLGQNVFEAGVCRDAMRECKKTSKQMEHEVIVVRGNSSMPFFLEGELTCVNIAGGPGPVDPNPYPTPGDGSNYPSDPVPVPAPGQGLINVYGTIESLNVNISGMNTDEVYNKCLDAVERAGITRADDMVISVNGHRYVRKTTGSWWYHSDAICNVLDSLMSSERLRPVTPSLYPITIKGRIENKEIALSGVSEAEVYNQCVEAVKSHNITQADDLIVSINGHKYVRQTTGSWWNTPTSICNVIDNLVPARIEPVYATGVYNAVGRIESIGFNLTGSSVDELFNQCVEFVQVKRISQADDVTVSINNSRRQTYRTGSWWNTPTSICEQVIRPAF